MRAPCACSLANTGRVADACSQRFTLTSLAGTWCVPDALRHARPRHAFGQLTPRHDYSTCETSSLTCAWSAACLLARGCIARSDAAVARRLAWPAQSLHEPRAAAAG